MKFLSNPLVAVLQFFSALAVHAATSDDMPMYSDRFNNGRGDNWSWMPRYATNSPVQFGSNATALVPSGAVFFRLVRP